MTRMSRWVQHTGGHAASRPHHGLREGAGRRVLASAARHRFGFDLIPLWVMARQGRGDVMKMLSSGLGEVWARGGRAVPDRGAGRVSPMGARGTEGKGLL
jgi:hypothetical protein